MAFDSPVTRGGRRLLFVQVGPVQEFITQARSTRDLWSGSYLITWMAAQVVAAVRAAVAGAAGGSGAEFVFPAVAEGAGRGQTGLPTLDWIEGRRPVEDTEAVRKALLPAVPNRLVALVPEALTEKRLGEVLDGVFDYGKRDSVWRRVADECLKILTEEGAWPQAVVARWHGQLAGFWQVAWLLTDGEVTPEVERVYAASPVGRRASGEPWGSGVDGWMKVYHAGSLLFDARRQVRDFAGWQGELRVDKDAFSGKEEVVISRQWLEGLQARAEGAAADAPVRTLANLFRGRDELGAPNAVKRVWHRAYLERVMGFDKPTRELGDTFFNIPSIPGLCAYEWATRARSTAGAEGERAEFVQAVRDMARYSGLTMPKRGSREQDAEWLKRVDWEVFQKTYWGAEERDAQSEGHRKAAVRGAKALEKLLAAVDDGKPERYFAVVAMDADGMGARLSGELLGGSLTKDFHTRLSTLLAEATVGQDAKVDPMLVVEDPDEAVGNPERRPQWPLCGKVIYAGADDFLVVVPATQALLAAQLLQEEFLKVMGKMDAGTEAFSISAGVAIGHMKEPLQDVTAAAFERLRHAKRKLGGNTVAVQLFKRSGEQVQWSAGFGSAAWELLSTFQSGYRQPRNGDGSLRRGDHGKPEKAVISGKFPHRLAEVLRPQAWQPRKDPRPGDPMGHEPAQMTKNLVEVALTEFAHVAHQQAKKAGDGWRADLVAKARAYLVELCDHVNKEKQPDPKPLNDFIHLFLTEAFITREDH